jgi:hypothetical protein
MSKNETTPKLAVVQKSFSLEGLRELSAAQVQGASLVKS